MPSPLQTIEIDPDATHHTAIDDAQGLTIGVLLASIGVVLLTHLGFVTGQTAGLALLIAYPFDLPFGLVFFVTNLPFYVFAWRRLGPEFTVKSALCVTAVSVLTGVIPAWMPLGDVNPVFGAIAFGVICGLGVLAIFRHKGSLGGLGVVALMIQDSTGFRAGLVQLIADAAIFAVALLILPLRVVLFSLLGALILNGVIAFNHRRDRYIAT